MEFQILFGLINEFQARLDTLNKKCIKYGNPTLSFTVIEVVTENNQEWAKIQLDGCIPKVGNYELIGIICNVEGKNLIKCVPGKEMPEVYRTTKFFCDHCGINRYRSEVVVVHNVDTGEYKQLGKQCLKDYLGISLENLVSQFTWINDLVEDCQDFDRCPKAKLVVSPEWYLTQVACCVRKLGYKPTSFDNCSTKVYAWNLCYPPRGFRKDVIEHFELYPDENDKEYAKNALEWAKDIKEKNDFEYNLRILSKCTNVEYKHVGYLAAIIPAYEKYLGKVQEYAKKEKILIENQYIGEPKKRMELDVECVFTRTYDTQYGPGTIVKFVQTVPATDTENGIAQENVLTWFASGLVDFEKGNSYKIKFTVKQHEVYQEKKQTIISRVKNIVPMQDTVKTVEAEVIPKLVNTW